MTFKKKIIFVVISICGTVPQILCHRRVPRSPHPDPGPIVSFTITRSKLDNDAHIGSGSFPVSAHTAFPEMDSVVWNNVGDVCTSRGRKNLPTLQMSNTQLVAHTDDPGDHDL